MAKISIIIPVYNVENYLKKCLDSCINQTFKNIDIIVVDDGSTDNSLSIAKEYAAKDKRIHLISQKNEGVSVARNKGIENSNSDWIMFLDSDDWLELDALEKMDEIVKKEKCDILITGFYENDSKKEKKSRFLNFNEKHFNKNNNIELIKSAIYETSISQKKISTNIGVPWAKLYNRKYLVDNNIKFKKGLKRMQDMIFNLDAFYNSDNIFYNDIPLYHYRLQNNSVTKKFSKDFYYTSIDILKYISNFINKNSLEKELIDFYKIKSFLLFNEIIILQYIPNNINFLKKNIELRKIYNNEYFRKNRSLKLNNKLNKRLKYANILYNFKLLDLLYLYNYILVKKYNKNNFKTEEK